MMRLVRQLSLLNALACVLFTQNASAWSVPSHCRSTFRPWSKLHASPQDDDGNSSLSSRRSFLIAGSFLVTGALTFSSSSATAASTKILVLGGTGLVGKEIVKQLKAMDGVDVVATSRDGRDGTVALDVLTANDVEAEVERLAQGCTGVISTIGSIGTPDDAAVNAASARAAAGASKAGVSHFAYISVAPEVREFAKNIDFLKPYMEGKAFSEASIPGYFKSYTLIEPTFIYGGDSFSVKPPRVASFYGKLVEGVLASAPLRAITGVAPEGFIKIALEPPVPVESVAAACIAGALGRSTIPVLDTYDKIQEAAKQL